MTMVMESYSQVQAAIRSTGIVARWLGSLLACTSLGLYTSAALAVHPYDRWAAELGIDQNASYDGTRVMEFQGGTFEMTERRAPGKMYTEMHVGDMTAGVILREDLNKSYILMPSMGFYKEETLEDGMTQASNGLEFSEIEKVGAEDVNGHASTKYNMRFKDKEGTGSGFVWVTDTGVPIKIDMLYSGQGVTDQRLTMQFTELNLRQQEPAYFEVPANLTPMSFSGGISNFGKLMGMGGETPSADSGSAAGGTDSIQSVTDSVSEGTKGLIKGLGGLFGMSGDAPEEAPRNAATSSEALTTDNLTQTVQLHLKALGYDPGSTDGENSLQTSIAISQFQSEKGLEVTGEVTPQLAGVLQAALEE